MGYQSGDLPVTDGGVLAHGCFRQSGVSAGGSISLGQNLNTVNVAQTGSDHIGDAQLLGRGAGSQGVDTRISEGLRIRHSADAEGVQHDQKYPFHYLFSMATATSKATFIMVGKAF